MYSYIPPYKTPSYIRNMDDFFTSSKSMKSFHRYDGSYVVISYSTVIAEYIQGVWYLNDTYYSPTTAKHQSYVRQALTMDILNDKSIHLYHVPYYAQSLPQYINGTVAMRRVLRIKAGL